jgi:MFS family permease
MIWVLAGLNGTVLALDLPSRQSFVYEIVGPDDLANAVGLNSVVINASRIVGPALAGLLIAGFGVAPCFFLNAASYVAVIAAFLLMRTGELSPSKPVRRQPGQVREGFRVVSTLAYNYSVILPLLTRDVYGRGGGAYGILSAAMGVGALAGALLMASRARPSRRLLVASAFGFGIVTVFLAVAPGYALGAALLVLVGVGAVLFISTTNALLQVNAPDAMRGRVMALWSIVFLGSTPIGGPVTGLLVRGFGVRWAVAVGGIAALATATGAVLALRHRKVLEGCCEAPVCLPDGPAPGDALGEAVEVGPRDARGRAAGGRPADAPAPAGAGRRS